LPRPDRPPAPTAPVRNCQLSELAPLSRSRYTTPQLPGGEEREYAHGNCLGI
jgi:hypothetical protein